MQKSKHSKLSSKKLPVTDEEKSFWEKYNDDKDRKNNHTNPNNNNNNPNNNNNNNNTTTTTNNNNNASVPSDADIDPPVIRHTNGVEINR